ncbi:MAG: flagellar hook-associated protein FlgK [Desulfonatronovibrio sp.]
MSGIGSIMDIGRSALFANQSAIQVVSNNVANANTPGYRRQGVRLEESMAIDTSPGQLGTGVNTKEVFRYFDSFIEDMYNEKSSDKEMWESLNDNLSSVEILFNESIQGGLNESMAGFWKDWQDLSKRPEDSIVRSSLMGNSSNLVTTINRLDSDLKKIQSNMDDLIQEDVDRVNEILKEISNLNKEINVREVPGKINLNDMRDKRDLLTRELAEKIDIDYIDNGGGDVTITTRSGHTLVDGANHFDLKFESNKTFANLTSDSDFEGKINYQGSSSYEITVQAVGDGEVDNGAEFRVSLDGGRTWLKDDQGDDLLFDANERDGRVALPVDDIEVWFEDLPGGAGNDLSDGDEFQIIPKSALYWYENTSSPINISPQVFSDGRMNERRITGGSLAGTLAFRDQYGGKYGEKLDATAKSLIWEANRVHSQGAGLEKFTNVTGSYQVTSDDVALGSASSGLAFGDKLQQGNLTVHVYDEDTGDHTPHTLDFGGSNFDPDSHDLEDVRDAINDIDHINASIVNNQLEISADEGYEFAFGNDTSGLLAGLGINTFFQGENSRTLAVNDFVGSNISYINAGHVNGAGEINSGDNKVALDMAELQHKKVPITTSFEGTTSQTIQSYYNSLVANVGTDTNMAKFNKDYNESLAKDLNRRQEEISGVNMDEEMSNLIKFQHSYQAASKLITTADKMLQTLIAMKN